jgi:hypothetical protein
MFPVDDDINMGIKAENPDYDYDFEQVEGETLNQYLQIEFGFDEEENDDDGDAMLGVEILPEQENDKDEGQNGRRKSRSSRPSAFVKSIVEDDDEDENNDDDDDRDPDFCAPEDFVCHWFYLSVDNTNL